MHWSPSHTARGLPSRTAAFGAAGLVLAHLGLVAAFQSNAAAAAQISGYYLVLASGLAALALFQAARRSAAHPRVAWAWILLGLALSAATLGNLFWALFGSGPAEAVPALPAGLILLAYCLIPFGLLLLPAVPLQRSEAARLLLDIGIVLVTGACLLGAFVIVPILAVSPADSLTQALAVLAPVLDFVLFMALTTLLFRQPWSAGQWPVAFLSAALTGLILTDAAAAWQLSVGPNPNHLWLDVGWTASYALIWLAGQFPLAAPDGERRYAAWTPFLPYLWVAGLSGALLWGPAPETSLSHGLLEKGFVVTVGLVLIRQFLMLRENRQLFAAAQHEVARRRNSEAALRDLNRALEARVFERTAQLQTANQELQASEARNRALLRAVPDLIFILDRAGIYLDIYAPAGSRHFMPAEQFLGHTLRGTLPPAVADLFETSMALAVSTGQPQTVEYPLVLGEVSVHFEARLMPYDAETILAIVRDITERRQAQAVLQESERRFRETLENVELVAVQMDRASRVTFCNDYLLRLLGWEREAVLGQLWFERFVPAETGLQARFVGLIEADAIPVRFENPVLTRSGKSRLIAWTNTTLRDAEGRVTGLASLGEDITLRRQAEDQLRASLQDKEVLLKEIHHRVKNNLQVISSLLNLQTRTVSEPQVLELLRDSQNRVRSMALVHEKLYRSPDLGRIDLGEYTRSLAGQLLRSYADQAGRVTLAVEASDCWLDVDTAVPCGLILNELVSNALKHAFPGERAGTITIRLEPGPAGQFVLSVQDTGVGLPAGMDFRESPSLGLQLVNSLVAQIDGTIRLGHGAGGTEFQIIFAAARTEA